MSEFEDLNVLNWLETSNTYAVLKCQPEGHRWGNSLHGRLVRLDSLMSYGRHPISRTATHLPPWWRNHPHVKMVAFNCSAKKIPYWLKLESLQAHSKYGTQFPIYLATIHTHHIGVSEMPLTPRIEGEVWVFRVMLEINYVPIYLRWWIPHAKWGIKRLLQVNAMQAHSKYGIQLRSYPHMAVSCAQNPLNVKALVFRKGPFTLYYSHRPWPPIFLIPSLVEKWVVIPHWCTHGHQKRDRSCWKIVEKVAWNYYTCQEMNNVWWSLEFCDERLKLGCLWGKEGWLPKERGGILIFTNSHVSGTYLNTFNF